ncbi:DUF4097 family beta strand repeat-containing protein [Paenibacillus endoradicis]|uniref:DUF4097 family beta strand repeat-containing protein n=1 Tax=Paenibacillus endoradicis TaxID=2972487 RepID=UPI0021590DD4|nr:DUF4097 domain-containing protein [Paenibacillus endoradicis]MCR8658747.1 DUF4097 domain-containing protein [Paenibacillus endoradicis]
MRKRWMLTAIILIVVGITGLTFNKFEMDDKTIMNVEKEWTFDAQTLNNITIIGTSNDLDVKFVNSDSNTGSILVNGNTDQETIEKINLASIVDNKYELDLATDFKFQIFNMNFKSTKIHITISLPKDHILDVVDIGTNSGNFNIDQVLAKQATFTSKSGNVNVINVIAEQATITTYSGNLKAENIQADDVLLSTKSGNINADTVTGNLQTSVNSGNIKIDNLSGEVTAKSSSGNVAISQSTTHAADVTVASGNVTFTTAEGFSGFYELRSNSGNIHAPDSIGTSSEIIKINTKSGNIKVK